MGQLVYILGRSGTGKSFSMRNFNSNELAVINIQGKILPFRGSATIEQTSTDDPKKVLKAIDIYAKDYKKIVVDDFQYLMANEFMRRAFEKGYDKFIEIGRHAWDIADKVKSLPSDVIVYIICHTDTDSDGIERLKTIGKMLDEKIFLEGMSTIVLKSVCSDGKYYFQTQNSGKDTIKSPADMFPSFAIENDLKYVDEKIRNYYGLGEHKSDEEMAKTDLEMAKEEIQKPNGRKKHRSSETTEEPKRRSGFKKLEEGETTPFDSDGIKIAEAGTNEAGEETPFDEVDEPKINELPKRRKRRDV